MSGRVFRYLTKSEAAFLDAAAARIIPADELGPGAREAGAADFIDGQLNSSWGVHGRQYRMGPWFEGTPQQGYQSPLAPQDLYREAIRQTNAACMEKYGKAFQFLSEPQQDEVLSGLECGQFALKDAPGKLFFDLLRKNVVESFFADPIWGGNKDKAGWRMIGFPGLASGGYLQALQEDSPYRVEPVSIADVEGGLVATDAQGLARHKRLP